MDHEKIRREQIRWTLLLGLNNARPMGAYEQVLLSIVQSIYQDSTQLEVRRELDYLEERKLVQLDKEPSGRWKAEIGRYGIDIVEYTVDCEPGIARPAKYW